MLCVILGIYFPSMCGIVCLYASPSLVGSNGGLGWPCH